MGAGPKVTNCTNATESHAVNTANYRPIRPLQAEKQRSPEQVQPAIAPRQANTRAMALRVKRPPRLGARAGTAAARRVYVRHNNSGRSGWV